MYLICNVVCFLTNSTGVVVSIDSSGKFSRNGQGNTRYLLCLTIRVNSNTILCDMEEPFFEVNGRERWKGPGKLK